MKEIGSEAEVDKALQEADDPQSVLWRGRATHINNLTRQLKDAKEMYTITIWLIDICIMFDDEIWHETFKTRPFRR